MKKLIGSFLRPCFPKILVGVLIFLVFAPFIYYDNGIRCIRAPCPSENLGSVINFFAFSYNNSRANVSYSLLALGLIVSYLIACVLVAVMFRKYHRELCDCIVKRN